MSMNLANAQASLDKANADLVYTLGLSALLLNAVVAIDAKTGLLVIHTNFPADRNEVEILREKIPLCVSCLDNGENVVATCYAPQTTDKNVAPDYVPVCAGHASDWYDGADFSAETFPMYSLK